MNTNKSIPTVYDIRRIADKLEIETHVNWEKMTISMEFNADNYTKMIDGIIAAGLVAVPAKLDGFRLFWSD